jgi:hypothetical protein
MQSIRPEILAMVGVPEAEISEYMLMIQDHLSYFQFDQGVHEHLHILQFPCHDVEILNTLSIRTHSFSKYIVFLKAASFQQRQHIEHYT